MSGTARKISARTVTLAASERTKRQRGRLCGAAGGAVALVAGNPAVAESGVVVDVIELAIDIAELLADALYEGADVRPEALGAVAGGEVLAVDEIVDLAIADILAGAEREERDDLELGQGQLELAPAPGGAADVEAQLELAQEHGLAG